jgi:RimJ/RimL family protein N-acetyltransferase
MCILDSDRLILRPPRPSDIPAMTVWLGDYDVTKKLARVPHPYGESDAEDFVALRSCPGKDQYCFTILRKEDGLFLGGISLHSQPQGWELGYWLGKPFWGSGYASEAARRTVLFAFEMLGAPHVWAGWFHDNPASGHVLVKLGMRHNGSRMRDSRARGAAVLCHEMLLTRADFLRKQAA